MTFAELLAPQRLNRVAIQHGTDPSALGVGELADPLIAAPSRRADPRLAEIRRRVAARAVLSLAADARSPALSPSAAASLDERLQELAAAWRRPSPPTSPTSTWTTSLARLIRDRRELDAV